MKKISVLMIVVVLCCFGVTGCAAKEESPVAEVLPTTETVVEETTVPMETEEETTVPEETVEEEVIIPEKVALGATAEGSESLSAEFAFNASK